MRHLRGGVWGARRLIEKFGGRSFRAMRFISTLAVLALGLFWTGAMAGEVISLKTVDGKRIACVHSGLFSELQDCGVHSDWYTYVFVGSIAAITPATGNEKKVRIVPEEVFSGKPDSSVTVETSQGLCFPRLAVGDRWLFYLRKEDGKPIVLDYYGNDSRPVADAKEEIATLRRLATIGDFAILRGRVWRGEKADPSAQVVAIRRSDGRRFVVATNAQGNYEFRPLPPGSYRVSTAGLGRPDEISLSPGICWDLTLTTGRR